VEVEVFMGDTCVELERFVGVTWEGFGSFVGEVWFWFWFWFCVDDDAAVESCIDGVLVVGEGVGG